uniref:Uncharacterized protein n=1 Tax=Strombidium rassoulzadegani TaxID=1082188 RepID=A0A7S3CUD7_9SPIT
MALKDYLAGLVENHDVGHPLNTVNLASVRARPEIVLHRFPALLLDMRLELLLILVNAESNDPHAVSPVLPPLLKHLLIVLHWGLAWRTPGGPEINHDHLTWLVLNGDLLLTVDGLHF